MSYASVLQDLFRRNEFSIKLGLNNIRQLLNLLGNPQNKFKSIHIAGTNGKGSVSAILASVLYEAGTRTALYTSPHLIDFRERIQVNGRKISRRQVLNGLSRIDRLIQREQHRRKNFSPTYFEIVTALAFDTFARQKAEIAVVETGLGGRLDATNLCLPVATVITHVDWDHQVYLGNSLQAIAFEKAGIIKRKVPLITAESRGDILRHFKNEAARKEAPLYFTPNSSNRFVSDRLDGEKFDYKGADWDLRNLRLPLVGEHQIKNACTALRVLETVSKRGFPISEKAVRQGLAKTRWPGRFEVHPGDPALVLDGSHNREGIQTLVNTLRQKKIRRVAFIFGMMKDKEIRRAVSQLSKISNRFYLVEAKVPRATPVEDLAKEVRRFRPQAKIFLVPDTAQALRLARRHCRGTGTTICICGSLYIVGEALQELN